MILIRTSVFFIILYRLDSLVIPSSDINTEKESSRYLIGLLGQGVEPSEVLSTLKGRHKTRKTAYMHTQSGLEIMIFVFEISMAVRALDLSATEFSWFQGNNLSQVNPS
jgi:hypothetical protein